MHHRMRFFGIKYQITDFFLCLEIHFEDPARVKL
jgi:hypothetical protein